jgi:hypothetical protein
MPGPKDDLQKTAQAKASQAAKAKAPVDKKQAGKPFKEGQAELSPEAQKKAAEAQAAKNKLVYEDSLGEWLGGELFDLVHKEVSAEKMMGHGTKGAEALMDLVADQVEKAAGDGADDAALQAALGNLKTWAAEEATNWLKTKKGQALIGKVTQWTETHPKTIATIAILAAVGAVAANVDLPKLKQKFKLGKGFSSEIEAELGKIRDIALESVSAALTYEKGDIKGGVKAGYENKEVNGKDVGVTTVGASLSAGQKGQKGEIHGTGEFTSDGDMKVDLGASGELGKGSASIAHTWKEVAGTDSATTTAKIRYGDKDQFIETDGKFSSDNSFKIGLKGKMDLDKGYNLQGAASSERSAGGDNRLMAGFGLGMAREIGPGMNYRRDPMLGGERAGTSHALDYKSDRLSLGLKANDYMTGKDSGSLGAKYSFDDLSASLDMKFGDTNTLRAGVDAKQDNYFLKGGLGLDLDRSMINEASLMFGYNDPKAFEAAIFEYKHTKAPDVTTDDFKIRLEHTIGDYKMRAMGGGTMKDGDFSRGNAEFMAHRSITDDIGLIGGVGHQWGPDATGGTDVRLGLQVKKVPVYVNYDFETKAVGLGITLSF